VSSLNPQCYLLFLLVPHRGNGSCANTEDGDLTAAHLSMMKSVKGGKRTE